MPHAGTRESRPPSENNPGKGRPSPPGGLGGRILEPEEHVGQREGQVAPLPARAIARSPDPNAEGHDGAGTGERQSALGRGQKAVSAGQHGAERVQSLPVALGGGARRSAAAPGGGEMAASSRLG